jgi:hypothetical protein
MLGSVDLGWENRRGGKYLQLHWHLAMWTSHPDQLDKKLKAIIRRAHKHERPVNVEETWDLGFLAYINKAIKLPDLLRGSRRALPELLLLLDRIEPLDLMVVRKLRVSAQSSGIQIRPITRFKRKCGRWGS